jgi:tetratricopeptide (TPR) repeat protein
MRTIVYCNFRFKGDLSFLVLFVLLLLLSISSFGQIDCSKANYDCQISESSNALKRNSKDPIAYYNRAVGYRLKGENEKALEDYTRAIELKPDFYQAYYNRSVIYYDLEQVKEATEDILKVLEINPKVYFAHYFFGLICYDHKDFEQALKSFNKAIELKPDYKKAYMYRAKVFDKLGEYEKAQSDLAELKKLENQSV